jgi:hypothetical protein
VNKSRHNLHEFHQKGKVYSIKISFGSDMIDILKQFINAYVLAAHIYRGERLGSNQKSRLQTSGCR